ncbi:hypothetical protein [Myceligenerans indicum]|uniref:Uncharacterized protein n=1 Tax=Myceligenerans indicum TaxID=2593663 RepID=A0ABS1LM08_9MICO|nr:hypothetical protein [Myceligenerans indicum]MBL0887164.1 hypothetical protein [Myceligenerans indicum]
MPKALSSTTSPQWLFTIRGRWSIIPSAEALRLLQRQPEDPAAGPEHVVGEVRLVMRGSTRGERLPE